MEQHKQLSIEVDKDLINKVFENVEMRYILLYLYIIRNDMLKNLLDESWLNSFKRLMNLDEILKNDLELYSNKELTEILIDLGIIKNLRSLKELEKKEDDFLIKILEPIRIEENKIIVPENTLFPIISKKFTFLTKRNFHYAISRLKGIMCENSDIIHPFLFEIGKENYLLADDLYEILDDLGNPYQTIKVETTISEFYNRFKELLEKVSNFIELYDPILNKKSNLRIIKEAIDNNKVILEYMQENVKKLPAKFDLEEVVDKENEIFKKWQSILINLLIKRNRLNEIDEELSKIKNYYSGKGKKYTYLEFITKISYNEDNILTQIKNKLIELREELVNIKKEVSKFEKNEIKLLNLDYERYRIINE